MVGATREALPQIATLCIQITVPSLATSDQVDRLSSVGLANGLSDPVHMEDFH